MEKFFFVSPFLYFPWWEGYKALLLGWVVRARHVLKTPPSFPNYSNAYCIQLVLFFFNVSVSYYTLSDITKDLKAGADIACTWHEALTPHFKAEGSVTHVSSYLKTINTSMVFYLIIQWGVFCYYSNRPHLSVFSSPNVFLFLDFCHLAFWHIAYLSLYLGLFWISVRSLHLPNPPIPLCQAQPPTVDPAIETTAHEIIGARPTHNRNKGRPTFTPIPTRWPTFPKLHKIQNLFSFFTHTVVLMHFKMTLKALLPNWVLKTNRWIHGTLPVIIIIIIADAQPNH